MKILKSQHTTKCIIHINYKGDVLRILIRIQKSDIGIFFLKYTMRTEHRVLMKILKRLKNKWEDAMKMQHHVLWGGYD